MLEKGGGEDYGLEAGGEAGEGGGEATEARTERRLSMHTAVQHFSPVREFAFVVVTCMAQFMTQAGIGICLSPLDIIGNSFHITNPGILSWLIAGYSLTVGTFILFAGRLGDLFGYRSVYVFGCMWYSIWSMVAGVSVYSNSVLFIFARTLQGIGPSLLLPNGLAILGATYTPGRRKTVVFSLFGATAPNGAICGAVFAALFSQLAWWPWTFFSLAIWMFILGVLSWLIIPPSLPSPARSMNLWKILVELDVIGAVLGIGGLVLINVAWNQAPIVGWQLPYVYVLLIIGAIILTLFFIYEIHFAPSPLIPFHALNADVSFILGCVACGWGSFGVWIFYTWRLLEKVRMATPLSASAQFTPPCVIGFVAAFSTAYLLHKVPPSYIMIIAMMAFTAGNALSSIMPVHQTYWAITFVTFIITPFGMDMSFPAATVILSNAVGREHQGIAASLVTTAVNYSISITLGIAGTVEVHVNNGGHTFHDMLKGYRGALYTGTGIGGLGLATSLVYLMIQIRHHRQKKIAGGGGVDEDGNGSDDEPENNEVEKESDDENGGGGGDGNISQNNNNNNNNNNVANNTNKNNAFDSEADTEIGIGS